MAKSKVYDRPQKVKTTLEEVEVLTTLKSSVEWAIFKRVCNKHIEQLRKVAFKLDQKDENFVIRHTELVGRALGIREMIIRIENMGKKKK